MEDEIIIRLIKDLSKTGKYPRFNIGLMEMLNEAGCIPAKYVDYEKIRQEFKDLVKEGTPKEEVKRIIADKYCRSVKNIEYIVYESEEKYRAEA